MVKAEAWGADAEDLYAERVKANIRWLAEVNAIALEAAAGMARIAPSALTRQTPGSVELLGRGPRTW